MCAKLPCVPNKLIMITQNSQEKADLQKKKVNTMKIIMVHADGYKLCTGKEWKP